MNATLIQSRPDFAAIAAWIPNGSSVLDLGCGDGSLLRYLRETRDIRGYGVEIDESKIATCIANGVNVIHSDLDAGLADFETDSFDFVILSQTLQATRHTEAVMKEIARVGREGIISFPNFGYWKNRLQIMQGYMPVSKILPYQWFDTPNVHLCTLKDFELLCDHLSFSILGRHVMNDSGDVNVLPNLRGSMAVYRFKRAG